MLGQDGYVCDPRVECDMKRSGFCLVFILSSNFIYVCVYVCVVCVMINNNNNVVGRVKRESVDSDEKGGGKRRKKKGWTVGWSVGRPPLLLHAYSLPGYGDTFGVGLLCRYGFFQFIKTSTFLQLLHQTFHRFLGPLILFV